MYKYQSNNEIDAKNANNKNIEQNRKTTSLVVRANTAALLCLTSDKKGGLQECIQNEIKGQEKTKQNNNMRGAKSLYSKYQKWSAIEGKQSITHQAWFSNDQDPKLSIRSVYELWASDQLWERQWDIKNTLNPYLTSGRRLCLHNHLDRNVPSLGRPLVWTRLADGLPT